MIWRKAELEKIKEALEREYQSADECAKTVADLIERLLRDRDSYAAGIRIGNGVRAFGGIYHLTEAKRLVRNFAGALGADRGFLTPLLSPNKMELIDTPPANSRGYCLGCKHPLVTHDWPGKASGCIVPKCRCKMA